MTSLSPLDFERISDETVIMFANVSEMTEIDVNDINLILKNNQFLLFFQSIFIVAKISLIKIKMWYFRKYH